jgi:hypothetical protein
MYDASNVASLSGTWQSADAGKAIQLFCNNEKTGNSVISLELEGAKTGSILDLSGGFSYARYLSSFPASASQFSQRS